MLKGFRMGADCCVGVLGSDGRFGLGGGTKMLEIAYFCAFHMAAIPRPVTLRYLDFIAEITLFLKSQA